MMAFSVYDAPSIDLAVKANWYVSCMVDDTEQPTTRTYDQP